MKDAPLKDVSCPLLHLACLFLLPGHREVRNVALSCPSAMVYYLATGPETMDLASLKLRAVINLSSFKQLFSGICHSDESLSNTVSFSW
jgi:hypothetical protein